MKSKLLILVTMHGRLKLLFNPYLLRLNTLMAFDLTLHKNQSCTIRIG